ncbi:MAG: cardiolipin synthase B [Bdellovibrio sp. CG10_big_fil_rev_8_21_14_0_10_47_8]|nr:MAG: cardiolipin synthase B [Bdellovibrio sp. CG10_big_fil_rev_8_21_14_0_10_47_8]
MSKSIWNHHKIYFSGDEYFRDVIKAIQQSQKEIFVESYIFDLDPIGHRILTALKAAQERGVHVRILVDGVGSFNWIWSLKKICHDGHLQFRIYHPLPIRSGFMLKISWKSLRRLLILVKRINKRNHRKIVLIDHKKAFLGSLNISQVHTKEFMGAKAWRDTGVCIEGPDLSVLHRACIDTWRSARTFSLLSPKKLLRVRWSLKQVHEKPLRLNSSMRWRVRLLRDLNRRMADAKTRILITNAYFVPRRSILRSLTRAAERGVFVGICLPAVTDVPIVQWASRHLYRRLLKAGVHIYEYQNRVLHAKTLVVDQWATVGSHNLNHRSLIHDLEVEVALTEPDWTHPLIVQWDEDIRHAREITMNDVGKATFVQHFLARLAYWFRYWI